MKSIRRHLVTSLGYYNVSNSPPFTSTDKSSPVSSSDKPAPDRPKKAKLSRMAAMVYESLLRRAQDDDEENDDEDDENDETFQGDVNGHSSDEEVNGAEDDESNCEFCLIVCNLSGQPRP